MEALLVGLAKLIQTVSKNLLSSFIVAFVILCLAALLAIHGDLEHISSRFPTVAQEQRTFDRTVALNDLIITELSDVVRSLNGDRVILHQFRNGQFDLNGVPFNFVTLSYSAAAPGISMDDRLSAPVPIAVYNDLLSAMWQEQRNPVCVRKDISEIRNPMLRYRIEQRGVQALMACPIVTIQGAAVGFVSVEYLRREAVRHSEVIMVERLKLAAARTVTFLMQIPQERRSRIRGGA